jgi:FkbH-like protein
VLSVRDLPWLPAAPADFRQRCAALDKLPGGWGAAVQHLATHRLEARGAARLGKAIFRRREAGRPLAPLSGLRLGVLSNATFDLVMEQLPAAAARHGVDLALIGGEYDQVMQEAGDPGSQINTGKLDACLLAVDHRWLRLDRAQLEGDDGVAPALAQLKAVSDAITRTAGCPVIFQTNPVPPLALFGSYETRVAGSVRSRIAEANRRIVALASDSGALLLDTAALAERIGTDVWFDPVQWLAYKLPFSADCIPAYADLLGRLLGAIRGKARKCLVLDLDNTIWGGVIGDDGLEGIVIGQGSATGEAFLAVQQFALDLRNRGVILAASSKNNDDVARRPFRDHPDMLLHESDIAVFQANWIDKPSNLEAIAKSLNLGLDALVLLDDNPAERAHVRAALPGVAVPELPEDPALFPWYLASAGYFESVGFSAEDRSRADSYASDAKRAQVFARAHGTGDYLSSLAMKIAFAPFDSVGRQRIAQLINKSNQFNLTTRRYTEAEVAALEADPSLFTMQVRLADRFGDLGMIGVVVCRPATHEGRPAWEIDSWLMSCRVLGRKVEEAMLAHIAAAAREAGIAVLVGRYVPTAKNNMVADHFLKLGFTLIEKSADGVRRFLLPLDGYTIPNLPLAIA